MGKTIKLHPKRKPTYKYGLNAQVELLPRNTKMSDVIKHLAKQGVSRTEFYADRAITAGSSKSIPYDRLVIYAQVFDTSIDSLVLQKPKAKSLRQEGIVKLQVPMK